MLTFNPPELAERLRAALSKLGEMASLKLNDAYLGADFDQEDFEDEELSATTALQLSIDRCDLVPLTIKEAIALVDEVFEKSTEFDGLVYHSNSRTLLRIRPQDAHSAAFMETVVGKDDFALPSALNHQGATVEVGLGNTSAQVALSVVLKDHFYDKYFPPMSHDDLFVEVRHTDACDREGAIAIAHAYLFELNSSLGVSVTEWPRVTEDVYPEDEEVEELVKRAKRLRPLLVGPGMHSLLREFNRGVGASDSETALLAYVKCIEYVSATVVRQRQYEDLRRRLLSQDALKPTATYLDGLLALFEENRQFTKDFEALKLTIEKCCDVVLVAKHAPSFLKQLSAIGPTSEPNERKQAALELSACLSATRNQLAHAKANYELTGKECHTNQLTSLAGCAKLAAEQCIRWYAAHNPDLRRV